MSLLDVPPRLEECKFKFPLDLIIGFSAPEETTCSPRVAVLALVGPLAGTQCSLVVGGTIGSSVGRTVMIWWVAADATLPREAADAIFCSAREMQTDCLAKARTTSSLVAADMTVLLAAREPTRAVKGLGPVPSDPAKET